MDLNLWLVLFSATYSWIICTVSPAPTGGAPTGGAPTGGAPTGGAPTAARDPPVHHVRSKRCSCASFLDKECVYFCHLDIIWVNTPERVVSYGLGNAPRTKRAAPVSMATDYKPRCKCLSESDDLCRSFCLAEKPLRRDAASRSMGDCTEKQCKPKPLRDTSFKRMLKSDTKRASPAVLRAVLKTRLLLEKWRARQRHRTRTREGESTAS